MSSLRLSRTVRFRYFYEDNLSPYQTFHQDTEFTNSTNQLAESVAKTLLSFFPHDKVELRILDVGCCDGKFSSLLVKELISLCSTFRIHYVGIDPSRAMLTFARNRFKNLDSRINFIFQPVGVYPPPKPRLFSVLGGSKFHFIVASFILAWLDDWNDALDQFLECLLPYGHLCLVHLSQNYGKKYAKFRRKIYEIANHKYGLRQVFAEDFEGILRKREIPYKAEKISNSVNLKEHCVNGVSETIEFLLHCPRNALSEVQTEAIKHRTEIAFKKGPLNSFKKMIWVEKK